MNDVTTGVAGYSSTTNGVNMTTEKMEQRSMNGDSGLTRQMTVQLSPEQYERLFFQPTPARGDLAKRLGTLSLLSCNQMFSHKHYR